MRGWGSSRADSQVRCRQGSLQLLPARVCAEHTLLALRLDLVLLPLPPQPRLMGWLCSQGEAPLVSVPGSERGCSRHCQMANTGERRTGSCSSASSQEKKPGGSLPAPALLLPGCAVGKGKTEWGQGLSPRAAGAAPGVGLGASPLGFHVPPALWEQTLHKPSRKHSINI